VKSIVELHGGRVRAESADGQGSRFVVQLPRVERAT
jgi:signal transduction histidine kinase